jgi:dihydroflavonol-4-reductase
VSSSVSFITGATGFVGGHLMRRLVAEHGEVRALARSSSGQRLVADAGALPIAGDLFDRTALQRGMEGCRTVFHVAGVNEMCSRRPGEMIRANVDGTVQVIEAAAAAGVARVVFTSSAATLGEAGGVVADEDVVHRGHYLSRYEESKHRAERAAFAAADRVGIDVVAVNPSSVQGPGRIGGSARLFLYALRARHPIMVDLTLSVVDIADCTNAHLLAAARGEPGRRYVVNGATVGVVAAVALLGEVSGLRIEPWYLPEPVARLVGRPLATVAQLLPGEAPLCREMLGTLLHGHRYDGSRIERELGLRYTPLAATLRRTVDWYRSQGLIDR